MPLMCRLQGSDKYCETGQGICCAECADLEGCEKSCLNTPTRCGRAERVPDRPPNFVLPVPRPLKGGRVSADALKTK